MSEGSIELKGIAELYARHRAELCHFLKRKFGAASPEAQDVVHQAFANLVELEEPATVQNPRAYLYRTTYHILIDERRRLTNWRRGVEPMLIEQGAATNEITPERESIAHERLAMLSRIIQSLPRARRRSFLSHRLHGLSCAEIARRDGYSESAVKKHVALAMAQLDEALARNEF